jgi:mono/diheme cytochrome c family protein
LVDFGVLYAQNCAGCHGRDGKGGASISLADSVFLAIADDAVVRRVAANGVPGTPMPAFAQTAGGMLTDQQIDALVRGIRAWAKTAPDELKATVLPSYAPQASGDPQRGTEVYRTYCSSCHGADGSGGNATSIVDGSYLALVSDQDLRVNVILGRPELGAPDWRNDLPGKPMSEQEISDVVSWLAQKRPAIPGQPYPYRSPVLDGSTTKASTGGIR